MNTDQSSEDKINKLIEYKKIVKQLVLDARKNGLELEIHGSLELKLVDKRHTDLDDISL